jgi:hypothetical protein
MPPMEATPTPLRSSAPIPVPKASGAMPNRRVTIGNVWVKSPRP